MRKMAANSKIESAVDPVRVERIVVERGRLACYVVVAEPRYRYVWRDLAKTVRESYPSLVRHSCVNARSRRFATVMDETSTPHLLEHIAIDIQVHQSKEGMSFVGATEWLDEANGRALVQLSFIDDLEALGAFKAALVFLNEALVSCGDSEGNGPNDTHDDSYVNEAVTIRESLNKCSADSSALDYNRPIVK